MTTIIPHKSSGRVRRDTELGDEASEGKTLDVIRFGKVKRVRHPTLPT